MSRRHATVRETALPVHLLAAPGTSADVQRLTGELAATRQKLAQALAREAALRDELDRTRTELACARVTQERAP
jgi:hypothetical protein